MLAEPKPKDELFVKADFVNPQTVRLFAYSSDAKYFVDKLAKFGELHPGLNKGESGFWDYHLFIYPSFDRNEVVSYIESYNQE